jgi:hypothetical protein
VQGYNAQLAVDSKTQVIVAAEVTQQMLDRGQLLTMMESAEHNLGQRPDVVMCRTRDRRAVLSCKTDGYQEGVVAAQ